MFALDNSGRRGPFLGVPVEPRGEKRVVEKNRPCDVPFCLGYCSLSPRPLSPRPVRRILPLLEAEGDLRSAAGSLPIPALLQTRQLGYLVNPEIQITTRLRRPSRRATDVIVIP